MDIYRAGKIAQDRMLEASGGDWDKKFTIIGPGGSLNCEWLDPYFGMFTIAGHDGFLMSKQIPTSCEVIMPGADADADMTEQGYGP